MNLGRSLVPRIWKSTFQAVRHGMAGVILLSILAVGARAQVDPNALAESARQAMAERKFAEAAEIYAQLASRFPEEPTLQANLGMALHFSARDTEAVEPLQKASLALPSSFPAHFALGASLSRLGRYGEAVAPLRQSTTINPQHPFARILLGEALEAVGEYSQAVEAWQALRARDATSPYAHAGLVRCNEELAARAIDQLQQRAPESPYMLRFLGQTRLSTGQYPSALYLFRSALERQPGVRAVHEAVALVYERAGQAEWAEIERKKAESLSAPDCDVEQSAECNFAAGRFDLAPPLTEESSLADLFWAARSYAALAEQSFEELASLPESVEQLTLTADILAFQQQYSSAADACRRALELREGSGDLERKMAELLYLAKRIDEARPLLERFYRSDPQDPRWAALLGNLLAEEQEYERAVPVLQSAVVLADAPATVRLDLGRSYLALDKPDEAVPHLSASLDLDADGSIHYQLAQAYQRLGMREQAREALTQYQALDAQRRQRIEASASLEITAPE